MDIGLLIPVSAPYAGREFVRRLGTMAEERGFHSLWVGEHVVIPQESNSPYPSTEDGELPPEIEYGELDPCTTLAYLAAVTETIRLGACTIVPQRNPVYTAKEIANVDWLSNGRVDFGAGLGWSKEEFEAVAAPFPQRGARCDSYLRLLKSCWEDPVSEYEDGFYQLRPCLVYPKPIQKPHVPIHILGSSTGALRRTAEFGNGFFPLDESPEEMRVLLKDLDSSLEKQGRTRGDIRVSVCAREFDLDKVKQYRDVGVDEVVLLHFLQDESLLEGAIDDAAKTIVEPAQRL